MLALRGIARSFGARRALADVSLDIAAGEAVLLVGRNGAGKTTLLRIATGFLDPDAGEVHVDGIALARERARAQARLGYLRLRAGQKGAGAGAVARALAAAALDEVAAQRIGTLSKGYRQRVGLADAL